MRVIEQSTTYKTARPDGAPRRSIKGVVLHHTGGARMVPPHSNGSWHWLIDRDGAVYAPIPPGDVAWHCATTDRWTPDWVERGCTWSSGSIVNSCTLGIELVSRGGSDGFADAQYEAFRELAATLAPDLWWVGHGEVQRDRRLGEPELFDWERAGFGPHDARNGRRWIGDGGDDVTDDEKAVVAALRETGYSATEAVGLIRAASAWSANAASLSGWIEKIGAQDARIAELEARLDGAGFDPTSKDGDPR